MNIPLRIGFLLLMSLLVGACDRPAADKPDLTLIHMNDVYRIDAVEDGNRGGMSRVTTIVRRLQADGREVRLTHGGDFMYPSLESQLWAGEQMIEAMNFLHDLAPMLVVPGNHEFDPRTPDSLVAAVRQSRFTWLSDNVEYATGNAEVDATFQRGFTFSTGERTVGVFSLTLTEDSDGNSRDYARIDDRYIDLAARQIEILESKGVDLIIGLTHLYLEDDRRIASLKATHPKFLFIVGGHEHEPEFEEGDADTAVIMKGASNARTIWQVDIHFGEGDAMPRIDTTVLSVDDTIPLDEDYQLIANRWRQKLLETAPYLESKLGVAALPLDGREVLIRNDESNLGNFIVDQMRGAFGNPPADLAFVNSGTLRLDDVIAGDITFEDIGRTFGFSSFLRYMTIDGGDFRTLVEAGFRGVGPSKGYFPQISGFRICVDRSRPNGSRIVQLLVPAGEGWAEIESGRDYLLVAPDYIYRGGDGYDFSRARDVSRPGSELQYLVLDAILNAQAKSEAVGAAVDPAERRIAFLEEGETACFK
ncbi:MAG TPA: 5'-nucleotidase C-terminal domain-containing protein [Woeseiaceae bacterium]|nr:5'-nucleotidase C-terminal domain-containing protein [Woeseiaceae bacterium]